jgi:hypothetical protein
MSNESIPVWKELEIIRATTKIYELVFTKNGTAQDISNWTIYFTVKLKMSDLDSEALIAKVITSHSEPTNGKTLITLDITDTNIPTGNYYYSIDYKDTSDNEQVLLSGRVKIIEPVLKTRT